MSRKYSNAIRDRILLLTIIASLLTILCRSELAFAQRCTNLVGDSGPRTISDIEHRFTSVTSLGHDPVRRHDAMEAAKQILYTRGVHVADEEVSNETEPAGGALAGERPRIIVSTDIGGSDPDDFQSLIHLLLYGDVLDIEGLIASPPHAGRLRHIMEVLDAYEADYPKLIENSRLSFPTAKQLRSVSVQGAAHVAPEQGWSEPTDGSRLIVERANAEEDRPLWVLVWGSMTDVAQALHDDPSIIERLRVYSIGSWNTRQDEAARDYVFKNHPNLWWIECDTTFRGMYMGGAQAGDRDNLDFVRRHVRNHGALGELFWKKKRDIKMGDTPSLLYLLRGPSNEPTRDHWGGAFQPTDHGPDYWTDDPRESLRQNNRSGAKTVNRWRADYLQDWEKRMDWLQ